MRRTSLSAALIGLGLVMLPVTAAAKDYGTAAKQAWNPNGTVYAIAVTDSTVYLGGDFTRLVNPVNGATVARQHLAAIDRATGAPVADWQPAVDDTVLALAVGPDDRVYAGGDFQTVNGAPGPHLAALDGAGQAVSGFAATPSKRVWDVAVTGDSLYVVGQFGQVNGVSRPALAKLDPSTGAVDTGFNAEVSGGRAQTLHVADGTAYVGGTFTSIGGQPRGYVGAVHADTGAVEGWAPAVVCDQCRVRDLEVSGDQVYAGLGGLGGRAVAWSRSTGTLAWRQNTDGDVQAVDVYDGVVYFGGHFSDNFGGLPRKQIAAVSASTGSVLGYRLAAVEPFLPGVWALHADQDALRIGGSIALDGQNARGYLAMPPLVRTTVLVTLSGCAKGCKVRLAQAHRDRVEVWATPWRWVKNGRRVFTVASERTRGMTLQIRAPWEGRLRGTTEAVARYATQAPGTVVGASLASRKGAATSCLAGTSGRSYTLAVEVRRAKVVGRNGKPTTGTRAWSRRTKAYWGPMRTAPKGVLTTKGVARCIKP